MTIAGSSSLHQRPDSPITEERSVLAAPGQEHQTANAVHHCQLRELADCRGRAWDRQVG